MVHGKKTKKGFDMGQSNLIDSLLSKGGGKKTKISSQKYDPPAPPIRKQVSFNNSIKTQMQVQPNQKQSVPQINKPHKSYIINNFHKAISCTKSDDIILKMLDLKEKDIIVFYKNLENLIGKDMSTKIKNEMAGQLQSNQSNHSNQSHNYKNANQPSNVSLCPLCSENKSNCVILLCGHLICSKCGKNINRCKYPCPKCKKPIKYIQYIAD